MYPTKRSSSLDAKHIRHFPIRWSLETMRDGMRGAVIDENLLTRWAISVGISLVFYLLARLLDVKVHDHIRVTGELNSV